MADDIEKLVLSISADTKQVQRALDRLQKDVDRSTKGIEKEFTDAGTKAGTSFDAAAQRVNRSFTVIEGGAKRAQTAVTQSLGAQKAATQQLQFQLNDIATQLSSGTSPFQVMAQQGGQVVQALSGSGGVLGALRLVGAAALNPFTLATVAITTLAGVATAYFKDTAKDAEDANKKLEEHRAAVKAALDAWDGAPPAELKAYADELDRVAKLDKQRQGFQILIDEGLKPVNKAAADAAETFNELFARLEARNVDAKVLSALKRDFKQMKEAIDGGNASVNDLLPLFTRLQEVEAQIGTTKGFDSLKKQIQDMIPLLKQVNDDLETTRVRKERLDDGFRVGPRDDANSFVRQNPDRPTLLLPNEAPSPERLGVDDFFQGSDTRFTNALDFLKSKAVSDKIAGRIDGLDDKLAEALAGLFAQFPNVKIVSATRTYEEQKAIYDSGVRPAARPGTSRHERGGAVDLRIPPEDIEAFAQAARQAGLENLARIGDPGHYQLAGQRDPVGSTAGSQRKSPGDIFQGDMDQIQRRIDLLNAEYEAQSKLNPAINDYGFAVEKAKIEQQLLNDAKSAGVSVTPELAAKIDTLASNYARATANAKELQDTQQRAAQASQEWGQLATTALNSITSALQDGKITAEEWLGIGVQIIQQLLQMKSLAGGGGGGGLLGGLFGFGGGGTGSGLNFFPPAPAAPGAGGLLGGLLIPGILHDGGVVGKDGYGHGRAVHSSAFAGARRFHKGLMPDEFPAILQRGEIVVPKGGYRGGSGQSEPQNVTYAIDVTGANGDEQIKKMVRQGVREGIAQHDKDINRTFGARMANAQARQL